MSYTEGIIMDENTKKTWACHLLTADEKLVMLSLCNCAGTYFTPKSVLNISIMCNLTKRCVRKCLQNLEKRELIFKAELHLSDGYYTGYVLNTQKEKLDQYII